VSAIGCGDRRSRADLLMDNPNVPRP
jgi:hypothetical protein